MIASPSAISSSTVNKLRPEKPCIATIEPISFRLIDNPSSPLQGEIRSDPPQLSSPMSKPSHLRVCRSASLITLGEGVRLDQVRFVHHLELAVGLGFADARLAPQVVIGVDL